MIPKRFAITLGFLLHSSFLCAATPAIGSVVNAASFATGNATAAPGSLVTLLGTGMAASTAAATSFPLPVSLAGVSVYVNGVNAPLIYVSPAQINFQMPWGARAGTATVTLLASGTQSNVLTFPVSAAAPGVFAGAVLVSATGQAAVAAKGRAIHAGEYLTVLATGLGAVSTTPDDGAALADFTLDSLTVTPTVTIGGISATVAFAGLAPPGPNPYTAGVYQLNVLVPAGVAAGDGVPVVVTSSGVASSPVNISVASGTMPSYAKFLELGPSSAVIARAITTENTCPAIVLNGVSQPMSVRAAATLPFYPVLSCEASVPGTTTTVAIEGAPLAMPVANPTRITVLGDTGCRMDTTNSQGCYDAKAWPVDAIDTSAIATNPQLILHNGDYHYRENPCMPGANCQGSPYGYNWDVWREDFFRPFNQALAVAPWIFVRGNHESCDRAWEGYFRFLDPRPMPAACPVYTDPYSMNIGPVQVLNLDSAQADDAIEYPDQIAAYVPQFAMIRQLAGPNTWLITHRPIWAVRSNLNSNIVMQDASGNDIPVALIISGHTHTFQTYNFSVPRAPQMIIGNSGDNLAANPTIPLVGALVGNATVTGATSLGGFGFATITPAAGGGFTVVSKDSTGATVTTCGIQPQTITCDK